MQQPIEERGRGDRLGQEPAPLLEREVAGDGEAPPLVRRGDAGDTDPLSGPLPPAIGTPSIRTFSREARWRIDDERGSGDFSLATSGDFSLAIDSSTDVHEHETDAHS